MTKHFSLTVTLLTLTGTIPFILSAFVALYPEGLAILLKRDAEGLKLVMVMARLSTLLYGAVILSFMAGARWGKEFGGSFTRLRPMVMVLAVFPAIMAWVTALVAVMPGNWMSGGMFILAGGFLFLLAWDSIADYPAWYFRLRILATLSAVGSLALVAFDALP